MDGLVQAFSDGLSLVLNLPMWLVVFSAAMSYLAGMIINTFLSIIPRIRWYLWELGVPGTCLAFVAAIIGTRVAEVHLGWFAAGFVLLCTAASCGIAGLWKALRILPAIWHSACLLAVCLYAALQMSIQARINGGEVANLSLIALKAALIFLVLLVLASAIRGVRTWHQWRMSRWFDVPVEKYYGGTSS